MKTGFLFSVNKTPTGVFKTLLPLLSFLWFTTAILAQSTVYNHPFTGALGGTVGGTTGPYTVQPDDVTGGVFADGLSNSSWSSSTGGWEAAGDWLQIPGSLEPASFTLTFDVADGYKLDLDQFNFSIRNETNGATGWNMTINGTAVGSGGISGTTTFVGLTAMPSGFPTDLSGTITVVINLTGGTTANAYVRLDAFQLTGTVYGAGPDQLSCATG